MNPRMAQLYVEATTENVADYKKECIILIDDIFRIKKLLFGMGETQHDEFLTDRASALLFDELYDMDKLPLEIVRDGYCRQYEQLVKHRTHEIQE